MAGLHTWVGLLPGWLLFIIFLFGTVAFFQQEISGWMRPELGGAGVTGAALDAVSRTLAVEAPQAGSWRISLPSSRGGDALSLSWKPPKDGPGDPGKMLLDPSDGTKLSPRDTRGGFFLYRFHFDLHYMPVIWARMIVSVAALAMLVAILSGIVTHKKIFADFFLLRFGKGQRSWLDAHNATAALALPFHLMMTYTGLVTLLFTLMPWAIGANFPGEDAFYEAVYPPPPEMPAIGTPARMLPLGTLVARAEAMANARIGYLTIHHPGDASAVMEASPAADRLGGSLSPVYLSAVTGAPLWPSARLGGAQASQRVMVDLHAGRFSSPVLRWLYFLSGVGGTVMVGSGLVLWTVKRRTKLPDPASPHFGFRLVERLNIGVIAGSCAGIAVYFLANRLLPLDMPHRAGWEINSLFITWGGLFVWTIGRPVRRAWIEALAACAILYALVPVVSALTTARGLVPSLIARDWIFAGFDLTMLATSAGFALAAWGVAAHKPKVVPRRKAAHVPAEAAA